MTSGDDFLRKLDKRIADGQAECDRLDKRRQYHEQMAISGRVPVLPVLLGATLLFAVAGVYAGVPEWLGQKADQLIGGDAGCPEEEVRLGPGQFLHIDRPGREVDEVISNVDGAIQSSPGETSSNVVATPASVPGTFDIRYTPYDC